MRTAIALAAHLITWTPDNGQIGVGIGTPRVDEYMILFVPMQGCSAGMKVYDGKYGDLDKALALLERSKVCSGAHNW